MSRRIPIHLADAVRKRAGEVCEYCRLPQELQEAAFHIDHIQPTARGGATDSENLALACVSCSLRNGARVRAGDPQSGRMTRIFHPRNDDWDRHFRFSKRWQIRGKTAIGRATVAALGLNRRAMVSIRRELARLGRYPKE